MADLFCGICRHATGGHYPNCPVLTGQPQAGYLEQRYQGPIQGINPQDLLPRPGNPFQFLAQDGYEVAKIYRESRDRLLEELKMQIGVNYRLGRENIDLRLSNESLQREITELQETVQELQGAITALSMPPPTPTPTLDDILSKQKRRDDIDDTVPF